MGKEYKWESNRSLKVRLKKYMKVIQKRERVEDINWEKGSHFFPWDDVQIIDKEYSWRNEKLNEVAQINMYACMLEERGFHREVYFFLSSKEFNAIPAHYGVIENTVVLVSLIVGIEDFFFVLFV